LPRPIPLDGLFVFLLVLFPSMFIGKPLAVIAGTNEVLAGVLVAFLVTWTVLKIDPQGRSLPSFLGSLILYAVRPKTMVLSGDILTGQKEQKLFWSALHFPGLEEPK